MPNSFDDQNVNKNWSLLYHLASNVNLQLSHDDLIESIGRTLIRETDYLSLHWRWQNEENLSPHKNWIFRKNDPSPEVTKLLNEPYNQSLQWLGQRLQQSQSVAFFPLNADFSPYQHALIIPVESGGSPVAYLQLFSQNPIPLATSPMISLANLLQTEISRQIDLCLTLERERDQVVQLAQASRLSSLGAMAGGIAHEINNPLTVIMGMLKMTIKELSGDKPIDRDKLSGVLEKARSHTERISKIVKGIRALSRDGSRDPFILSKVQDIIDNTLALCEVSLKTNSIQLTYDLENPDQLIQCRPVQISQVILNLINNSMDAIGEQTNPWIHVGVRNIENNTVEFSVTDSGSGIPEPIAIRLMQPFFTTKGAGKGTGLGLSISKEIVKAHSGSLTLDKDSPNTRFIIRFPVEQKDSNLMAS